MVQSNGERAVTRRWISSRGRCIDLAEVAMALRKSSLIEECVVLAREATDGVMELAAYVVPTLPSVPDRLKEQVKSIMPSDMRCFCVPVSTIPLTETGEVDDNVLMQLPVFDEDLLQRWDERLQAFPGISQAAVVVQEMVPDQPLVHLADLIAGWKPTVLQNANVDTMTAPNTAASARDAKPRPPAFADGGPLVIPDDAPKTLTEAMLRTAQTFPHKGILHVRAHGEEFLQSYPALVEQARRILAGLHAQGLRPGDRVLLQCELLSDHFASFWACVLGGITPVNVAVAPSYADRNAIVNKLYNIWKLLKHPAVITSAHLVTPLHDLERFFPGETFSVLSVDELQSHPPTEDIYESKPDDLVFLQLTSGSTGVPKCIQESHRSIIAHIHGSAQFNGYSPADVVLNWLPVDHVVPTLTVNLKDVYLGCQEIQVATNVVIAEPLHWLDLMEAHKVTHSWAPNFGFKLVADRLTSVGDRQWDLSLVKFLMNAGEQVTLPVVSEFLQRTAPFGIIPRVMQPSFGMAEVCTCMSYNNDFSIQSGVRWFLKSSLSGLLQPSSAEDTSTIPFVDLGPPIPGVQIRITDAQNQVVSEGEIGRLQIRGDVTTRGYLYNDRANEEAFVGEGWFNSGDLGFIWNGRLTLTGREKEMIVICGANFYCYEIEDVVNALPGVEPTFASAVAVHNPAMGSESLAIFFVPRTQDMAEKIRLIEQIRKTVASNLGINPVAIIPLRKSEFPKTTSGKIQRNQIKESLAAGQYDTILKEIDIALGHANTLPHWFCRKVWRRKEHMPPQRPVLDGASVVFLDASGLGERLCDKLAHLRQQSIRVVAGTDFARLDPQRYHIDPANPDHYRRLLASIADEGLHIHRAFHLWTYGEFTSNWDETINVQRALHNGVFSLLLLVQALSAQSESRRPSRLVVASSHSQRTSARDTVDPTRSMVLGLVKTIPQEMPWLACSHMDLPGTDLAAEAEVLLAEALSHSSDREAVWRDGGRWVPRLQPIDFQRVPRHPLPFKQGGLYILTGGLGGIGVHIARYLLDNHHVRLLILGRTPLPDRSAWADYSATSGVVTERLQAYQELEHAGDIAYESVDICDAAAVRAAAERAMARWKGALDGVIHLAGCYQERLLSEETRESFTAVLGPKVLGALALHQLLREHPEALFVSFSSVNGFFGGFSVGAYAIANAFLDAFTDYRRQAGALRSHCLAWSQWDETGISRGFAMKQLARTRGYYSILCEQGIHSFQAALHQDCAQVLIGLDATKPAIRRYLDNRSYGLLELSAYFVPRDHAVSVQELEAITVEDRYRTATRCRFRRVDTLPLTLAGEIDRQQLSIQAHAEEAGGEPLQTDVERKLADVWTGVLGVNRIGRNDNFFDLGGHSLSAVQLTFKIQQAFNIDISLKTFLEAPVLSAQAQQLEEQLLSQADASELEQLLNEIDPTV